MGFSRHKYWSGVPLPSPKERANLNQFTQKKSISLLSSLVVLVRVLRETELIGCGYIKREIYFKDLASRESGRSEIWRASQPA